MSAESHSRRTRRAARARRGGHGGESGAEERDRWLISYADLVTLLFALFVVLYAAADRERAAQIARSVAVEMGEAAPAGGDAPGGRGVLPGADSLVAEREAIERAFAGNETLRQRARVSHTERGIVVSLDEAGFFASGDATLREDAQPLVDALGEALRGTDAPLRVEGHTDSTPISNARFPSNWELSSARASGVLARLSARGVSASRLSVAGYGGERPAATNDTPEGRARNRRVDVVILRGKS